MHLTIDPQDAGGITILNLNGRVVAGMEADALRDCINQLMTERKTRFVLNLKKASFIDSTGAGALVLCFTKAKAAGGNLKLAGPNDAFRTVLEATNLVNFLEIYENEEEAVASFG